MDEAHQHKWEWYFKPIDQVDVPRHLACDCGATYNMEEIEDLVNSIEEFYTMKILKRSD